MTSEGERLTSEIDDLAREIASGTMPVVASLFAAARAPAPIIDWSPDVRSMRHRRMRRFSDRCDLLGQKGGPLPDHAVTPDAFGPLSEWMMILRYDRAGRLVYDHYGAGIARVYGTDMTGRSPEDFPAHIAPFFSAMYEAARRQRRRVFTSHQPPKQVFVTTWQRLAVPMEDAAGRVTGFAVLNLPEHALRAGLEVVPLAILVVDDNDIVRYANRVGRERFDNAKFGPWTRSMFEYAGLDLQIATPPGEVLVRGLILHQSCRQVSHSRITPFSAIINATLHHGTAFYVVTLQSRDE